MGVKFVKPTHELVQAIAMDMREADVNEIWASDHYTPVTGLMESWKTSEYSSIFMADNEPCLMVGLAVYSTLGGVGIPWLLGSNAMMKHGSQFMRMGPAVIDEMLNICPKLVNYVHKENEVSVRWLKRVGFEFDEAVPYGVEKELFHRFHLERIV